jgi:hypothetical protein
MMKTTNANGHSCGAREQWVAGAVACVLRGRPRSKATCCPLLQRPCWKLQMTIDQPITSAVASLCERFRSGVGRMLVGYSRRDGCTSPVTGAIHSKPTSSKCDSGLLEFANSHGGWRTSSRESNTRWFPSRGSSSCRSATTYVCE